MPQLVTARVREAEDVSDGTGRTVRQLRLRAELIAAALELFRKQGYEATNVIEVAQAAGISHRTFFRYFRSKDDLAFGWLDDQAEKMRGTIRRIAQSVSPLLTYEQVLLENAERRDRDRAVSKFLIRLIFETSTLNGRFRAHIAALSMEFSSYLAAEHGLDEKASFRLRVQVEALGAAYTAAQQTWAFDKSARLLSPYIRDAFAALGAIELCSGADDGRADNAAPASHAENDLRSSS